MLGFVLFLYLFLVSNVENNPMEFVILYLMLIVTHVSVKVVLRNVMIVLDVF